MYRVVLRKRGVKKRMMIIERIHPEGSLEVVLSSRQRIKHRAEVINMARSYSLNARHPRISKDGVYAQHHPRKIESLQPPPKINKKKNPQNTEQS